MSTIRSSATTPKLSGHSGDYEVRISDATVDARWDSFVRAKAGDYPQASLWAQAKSSSGYQARRITIEQGGEIIGGAQLLLRRLPAVGAFGYVPLGPVLRDNDPFLVGTVIKQIRQLAKEERIRFLAVQPPLGSAAVVEELRTAGFEMSSPTLAPTATVLISLASDLEKILSEMSATRRKHIRRSEKSGVSVREGTAPDLAAFYNVASATARRRGFDAPSEEYLAAVWRAFAPTGNIKMFIAEKEGEALSALIVIAFGNKVTCWRMGWNGKEPALYPNEAMHWAAIGWAKAAGYEYFDLGGIHPKVAKAILGGESVAARAVYNVDKFKLDFGGQATLSPEPVGYVGNPVLKLAWPLVAASMARTRQVGGRILSRVTGR